MIHLKYDWRRRIVWAIVCLVFFLGSHKSGIKKGDEQLNDLTKAEKWGGSAGWMKHVK